GSHLKARNNYSISKGMEIAVTSVTSRDGNRRHDSLTFAPAFCKCRCAARKCFSRIKYCSLNGFALVFAVCICRLVVHKSDSSNILTPYA
ncbi:hypothetical protein HAX54_037167, partial [Datura stramonium]|nr:hypothetical protein [Datura stramonium]